MLQSLNKENIMDKWERFGNRKKWQEENKHKLEVDYKDHLNTNYTPTQPASYCSFEDFCIGVWQRL